MLRFNKQVVFQRRMRLRTIALPEQIFSGIEPAASVQTFREGRWSALFRHSAAPDLSAKNFHDFGELQLGPSVGSMAMKSQATFSVSRFESVRLGRAEITAAMARAEYFCGYEVERPAVRCGRPGSSAFAYWVRGSRPLYAPVRCEDPSKV